MINDIFVVRMIVFKKLIFIWNDKILSMCVCVRHLDNNYLLSWCRVSWPIDNALTINFEKSSRLAYRFHRSFFRIPIRSCAISTVEGGFLVASGGPNKQFSLESRQLKFHQSQCNRNTDFSKMFWHAVKRTLVLSKENIRDLHWRDQRRNQLTLFRAHRSVLRARERLSFYERNLDSDLRVSLTKSWLEAARSGANRARRYTLGYKHCSRDTNCSYGAAAAAVANDRAE